MKRWFLDLWKSLFPHDKWVRWLLTGLVVFFILVLSARHARADSIMVDGGVQYLRGPAAAIVVTVEKPVIRDTSFEAGFFLVGSTPEHKGVMGIQGMIVDGWKNLDIGIGVAYMNRVHEQLGSQLDFAMMLRYNLPKEWHLAIRHYSNAGTTENNTGLDLITFGRGFK